MDNLENTIQNMATKLASITNVQQASMPSKTQNMWRNRIDLHSYLSASLSLLPIRTMVLGILDTLHQQSNIIDGTSNTVRYHDTEVEFHVARHLAFCSYICITWSLYDRLSNVCGRLIGRLGIGSNQEAKSNPKIVEHFLRKMGSNEKLAVDGFSLGCVLHHRYAPTAIYSYTIRNWLVHEGHEVGGISLFQGDDLLDKYTLHPGVAEEISKRCKDKITDDMRRSISDAQEPFHKTDLRELLVHCHTETDDMFRRLLTWSVNSFCSQIMVFTEA